MCLRKPGEIAKGFREYFECIYTPLHLPEFDVDFYIYVSKLLKNTYF